MKSLKLIIAGLISLAVIFGNLAVFMPSPAFAKDNDDNHKEMRTIHLMAKLKSKMSKIKGKGEAMFHLRRQDDNKRMLEIKVRNLKLKDGTELKVRGCGSKDIGTFKIDDHKGKFKKEGGPFCYPKDKIKIMHKDKVILWGKFKMEHHNDD